MDESNKNFAEEIMKQYGEDRFYHASIKTSGCLETERIFNSLYGKEADFDIIFRKFRLDALVKQEDSITFYNRSLTYKLLQDFDLSEQESREHVCRIAFTLCKFYKSFGLRSNQLPPHLHARMVFGEKNEWVDQYAELMKDT